MPVPSLLRRAFSLPALLLAALLWSAVPAQAQDVQTITFEEAVQIALRQNAELRRAANDVEIQHTFVSDNRMAFVPNLSVATNATQSFGRNIDPVENVVVNQTSETINAGLSTGINVFNGFRDVASLQQARLEADASEMGYERRRQTVVFQVISNYLTLIQREEQIRIQEENMEAQRQQVAQIQAMVDVGARAISDLYQQQATAASAELALINAERDYQLAEVALIQTLQLDPFGSYRFAVPTLQEEAIVAGDYALGSLLENAYARRPDLDAQSRRIEAADEGVRIARSSMLPSVDLRANYGSNWSSFNANSAFFDQLDLNRGGSYTMSVSFPLFDRFSTRNNTQRARVAYANARLNLDDLRQDIALQVRQAYLEQRTAVKQLDVAQKQLQAAQQALDASQERYDVGAATLVELQESRSGYVQAQSDLVSARYSLLFQDKLIAYYTGTLDPADDLY